MSDEKLATRRENTIKASSSDKPAAETGDTAGKELKISKEPPPDRRITRSTSRGLRQSTTEGEALPQTHAAGSGTASHKSSVNKPRTRPDTTLSSPLLAD